MRPEDFQNVRKFTQAEVEAIPGEKIERIQAKTIYRLDEFRRLISRRVRPLCFTTGTHSSEWHPNGEAVDFFLDMRDGPIDVTWIFVCLVRAGFTGIGVYWNGSVMSFHVDTRPDFIAWTARKEPGDSKWEYGKFKFPNPKEVFYVA